MKPNYRYETTSHYISPGAYEYQFNTMVVGGWRLVCVVKKSKESFVAYWEKPYED